MRRSAGEIGVRPEQHTLLIFHVATSIGGSIPDSIVAAVSQFQLGGYFSEVQRSAAEIRGLYVTGFPRVFTGRGEPIPYTNETR